MTFPLGRCHLGFAGTVPEGIVEKFFILSQNMGASECSRCTRRIMLFLKVVMVVSNLKKHGEKRRCAHEGRSIWHPPFLGLVLRKGEAESIGMHLERNLQMQISFHRLRKKPYESVTRDA